MISFFCSYNNVYLSPVVWVVFPPVLSEDLNSFKIETSCWHCWRTVFCDIWNIYFLLDILAASLQSCESQSAGKLKIFLPGSRNNLSHNWSIWTKSSDRSTWKFCHNIITNIFHHLRNNLRVDCFVRFINIACVFPCYFFEAESILWKMPFKTHWQN